MKRWTILVLALFLGCTGGLRNEHEPAPKAGAEPKTEESATAGLDEGDDTARYWEDLSKRAMKGQLTDEENAWLAEYRRRMPGSAKTDFTGPGVGLIGGFDELWVVERRDVDVGQAATVADVPRGGELRAHIGERVLPLPLKHTDVKARVALHVASVVMTQEYENPFSEKIEAVYVFPLPQDAAVTDFFMKIGERTIRGIIREREEAQRIYYEARRQGYTASLLTQERPNIFTQRVANIEPSERIDVEIAYFHTLRFEDDTYEFVLPTVVGPRFNPPGSTDGVGAVPMGGHSGQATQVEYLRPREVSGHMISVRVDVDAGLPVRDVACPSHLVDVARDGDTRFRTTLRETDRIPNRDFILRWKVPGDAPRAALAVHRDGTAGYVALLLQPPESTADVPELPREMVFVVDCSGSMEGEPLSACKRAMRRCLDRLRRNDTFQVIRFSEGATALARRPLKATPDNLAKGKRYIDNLEATGGTMMVHGIRAALNQPRDSERYRIVTFMTDGYIGNEADILAEVRRNVGDARIFSFGVGNSVNRYLLERMAGLGRGVAAYISTDDAGDRAADLLYRRLEQPAMTDLSIDWGGLTVDDPEPATLPDLFQGRPIVVTARTRGGHATVVKVRGKIGGRATTIEIPCDPATAPAHDALGKLWARARIARLSDTLATGGDASLATDIRDLALRHGLASAYTAFVAVDSSRRTEGDHGVTVNQPVPVPQGTRYDTTVPD